MNTLATTNAVREFDIELEQDEVQHAEVAPVSRTPGDLESGIPDSSPPLFPLFSCLIKAWLHVRCQKEVIETTRRVAFRDHWCVAALPLTPTLLPPRLTPTPHLSPHVFARIRAAMGISVGGYVKSLKNTAREKLSAGASGAFMFFTKDGKYLVKSCTPQEKQCLLRILVHYAEYIVNNKGSFLTRFLGCHSIKMYGRDYSFVVMANIFNTTKVRMG
jgi:hypothetical protein